MSSVPKASPSLPGGRLAFERAIRRSSLPAPARHVALTIATWADIATGVIPERFQPSLSTIAEATGMGATTVKRHLGVLESEGWLVRDRPEIAKARREHARTQYVLNVPLALVGHGPERTMPMGQSGPSHGPERAKAWSAAGHKSSCSSDEVPENPTASVAEPVDDAPAADSAPAGGGGGSALRATAEQITSALDYRGQPPTRQQQTQITDRLLAALEAGWSVEQLAIYLNLGDAAVRSPVAVYAHRLAPEQLPAPPLLPVPHARRGGSRADALPAGAYTGLTVNSVLFGEQRTPAMAGGHRPYSNDTWRQPADPVAAAKSPWCGEPDCDPDSRLRGVYPNQSMCDCHPKMQWP